MHAFRVGLVALLLGLVVVGCKHGGGGGASTGPTVAVVATQQIGASGGSVEVTDASSPIKGAKVVIPAGALSATTTITIGEVTSGSGYPANVLDVAFGPAGTTFQAPVTLTIPYTAAYLTSIGLADETQLRVAERTEGGSPIGLGTFVQDTAGNLVSVQTTHFTDYAAVGFTVDTLSGDYTLIQYQYQTGVSQPNASPDGAPQQPPKGFESSLGTLTFTHGSVTLNGTRNQDGTAGVTSGSGTYSISPDGTFTLTADKTFTGFVLAGGSVAILTSTGAQPTFMVAIRKGGLTTTTLSGAYAYAQYSFDSSAQQPNALASAPQKAPKGFKGVVNTLSFQASGSVTINGTTNVDGTTTASSGSANYTLDADGNFNASSGGGGATIAGSFLAGGEIGVITQTDHVPQVGVAVQRGAPPGQTLSGAYGIVMYGYDNGATQQMSSATGTPQKVPKGFNSTVGVLTLTSSGNASINATRNEDGTPSPTTGTGTYTIDADGTFHLNAQNTILGGFTADGAIGVFGAVSGSPNIAVLVRR